MPDARQPERIDPTQQELLNRDAQLQAILDTAVDGIITINDQGIVQSINRAAEGIFGYNSAEVIGKNITLLMPSPYRENHDQYIADYIQTGIRKIIGTGREVAGLRKNGETFPLDLAVSEVQIGDSRLFTGIIRDITERKQTEDRLLQAERLAAIGEAMAGLAHESRNALQRSQASLEMLSRRVNDRPEAARLIERIQKAQDDLYQLYEDVREYAAPIRVDLHTNDVREIVNEALDNLSIKCHDRDVTISERNFNAVGNMTADISTACPCDAFALRHVFRNIIENSLFASSDPVRIEVTYREVDKMSRPYLCVSIRDNGPGLTNDECQRIFEPFFTTKTTGTGLGMAIATRIVAAHNGQIDAHSHAPAGTEIVIHIPRNNS